MPRQQRKPQQLPQQNLQKQQFPQQNTRMSRSRISRRVIAKSMHASLSNMAQLTLNASFDATEIMAYRAALKANGEKLGMNNITLNDMVLFGVAKTLLGHRDLNANFLDDKDIMRYFSHGQPRYRG